MFGRPLAAAMVVASAAAAGPNPPADGADFMFRATVGGVSLEGRPLTWTDHAVTLLSRDGSLHEFAARQARGAKKTASRFRGYSVEEMRQRLTEELGSQFQLSSTQHYLVAHPRGERGVWAERFESMYRAFIRYFRVRGFAAKEPPYPLVAIVFGNRSEYQRYVQGSRSGAPTGALGHYEPRSNRVYLYDQSSAGGDDRWDETASTVIHEVTHQTAYNVGVHTRFAQGPRWVSEGLATMFEARGVYDARSYDRGDSRVNRGRLADYRRDVAPNRPLGSVATFIASDQAFERTPILAYAQAWALTFFLAETRPQEYARYLSLTAQRPHFTEYAASARVADFRSVFGGDLELLDAQFASYLADVR